MNKYNVLRDIKYLRTHAGLSLKEARDIVESHGEPRKLPDCVVLMNARGFAEFNGHSFRRLNDSAVLPRYGRDSKWTRFNFCSFALSV